VWRASRQSQDAKEMHGRPGGRRSARAISSVRTKRLITLIFGQVKITDVV